MQSSTVTIAGLLLTLAVAGCDSGRTTPNAGTPPDETSADSLTAAAPKARTPAGQQTNATAKSGSRITLPSGLEYTVLKEGQGDGPKLGSTVQIHCVGRLANGQEFWNTRTAGVPQRVTLTYDKLITGVIEALISMKPGERRQLHIPSHLGYGNDGYPYKVPPRADLEMDLELVSIEP